jgi:hypothetical protein
MKHHRGLLKTVQEEEIERAGASLPLVDRSDISADFRIAA